MSNEQTRAARIAAARAALAARRAADPTAVDRFEARMATLAAARKRERERFDTRVLGNVPIAPALVKPAGMSRAEWKVLKPRLREQALHDQSLAVKWSHKQGTPETLEHAANTHQGAIAQLLANGTLNTDQVEWVAEIANVHRSIESDVAVAVASLEARVDHSRSSAHLAGEGVRRVRMHHAYTIWREQIPAPKQLVLDMIVGDAVGYTVAARRYRMHNRRARRLLIEAIDRWPACVARAFREVDAERVSDLNRAAS